MDVTSSATTSVDGLVALRVEVLGPVRAWLGDRELELGPPLRRGLFVVLAMRAGRPATMPELIDALWGEQPPATAEGNLHTYLTGLRRSLEPDPERRRHAHWLVSTGSAYRLAVDAERLDAHRFERHRAEAVRRTAEGDLPGAVAEQDAALALWRGAPLPGVPGPFAAAERTRLTDRMLSLAEDRARALLDLGRQDAALAVELAALAREHPFREQLRGLLMLVQYRLGRQADAMATFDDLRQTLAEELSVAPDEALRRLYDRVRANDPTLGAPHSAGALGPEAAPAPPRRPPAQLPHDIAGFANRFHEMSTVEALAAGPGSGSRVVVLAGTAGVGKTALAVHMAHRVRERYPDGQIYLDLRGFDPQHAPVSAREAFEHLLRALGHDREPVPGEEAVMRERFLRRTAGRRLLVLLDNAATADQVRPLLTDDPAGLTLVTSRNRLTELTGSDGAYLALDVLSEQDSITLLRGVIGQQRLSGEPDTANEITRLCGRLPLALRLAAARLVGNPTLRLADVVEDLTDERARLDVLASSDDQAATVRSVFSWSYRALEPAAARLFRFLGLHPTATFSAYAAAATAGLELSETRRHLAELLRGHLVEKVGDERYRLHDLLRVYAAELVAADESDAERTSGLHRMLDWYIDTADAAGRKLNPLRVRQDLGPRPRQFPHPQFDGYESALHWLETELGTLTSAVRRAADLREHRRTWQLAAAMFDVLYVGRHWEEWTAVYELGAAAARTVGDEVAAMRLSAGLGFAYIDLRRFEEAERVFATGREYWARVGDPRFEANCLQGMGIVLTYTGRITEALAASERGLAIVQELGDRWSIGWLLNNIGAIHRARGDYTEASRYLNQALTLCETNDHPACEGFALVNLGNVNFLMGKYADARRYLVRAISHCRRTGARLSEAHALLFLGKVADTMGNAAEAREYWQQSWAVFNDLGDVQSVFAVELRSLLGLDGAEHR